MATVHPNRKYKLIFAGFSVFLLITACRVNTVYQQSVEIPKASWDKSNKLEFEIPVKDTIQALTINFNIRNNNSYPYSNIYLFVDTYSPNGNSRRDTLEFTLADEEGKWLGSGIGGIWEKEYAYRKNIRFPNSGNYKIVVTQAMRTDKLQGIVDFGVHIIKFRP